MMKKSHANTLYKATYLVSSLASYINVLEDIANEEGNKELWFRGHNQESWVLRPNIMRDENISIIGDDRGNPVNPHSPGYCGRSTEIAFPAFRKMLPEIKEMACSHGYDVDNDLEIMAFGQHYNLLTPLIDWSEDPMIAMFFAMDGLEEEPSISYGYECENCRDRIKKYNENGQINSAAAILVMDPAKANFYSPVHQEKIFMSKSFSNENIDKLLDGYNFSWLCFKTPKKGYRISRQSGNFLLQGFFRDVVADNNFVTNKFMYKIYIVYECVKSIKRKLKAMRITKSAIYGNRDEADVIIGSQLREKQISLYKEAMTSLANEFEQINKGLENIPSSRIN